MAKNNATTTRKRGPGKPFEKGNPGRPVGSKNKRSTELQERLAEAMGEDWCPIVELAKLSAEPDLPLDLRVRVLSEVAPYVEPRRKAVEHSGGGLSLESIIVATNVPEPISCDGMVVSASGAYLEPRRDPTAPAEPPAAATPPSVPPVHGAFAEAMARIADDGDGTVVTQYDPFSRN